MAIINYISTIAVPSVILLIVLYGMIEKNKVYDTFVEGAKEGMQVVVNIFPTLVGIFLAVGALRSSGLIDAIIRLITPIINLIHLPAEIMPLALLRPISGSASMAVATDIISKHGVDSIIRTNLFYHHGVNRNDILYHCTIHKCSRNQKDTLCINRSTHGRSCWNVDFCSHLSIFVVKFLLTFVEKSGNIVNVLRNTIIHLI